MWVVATLLFIEGALAIFLGYAFWKSSSNTLSTLRKTLEKREEITRQRKESVHHLREENALLDRRISDIIDLYEGTKKLSTSLEFQEFFTTLSQLLRANFRFEKGYLLLLHEEVEEKSFLSRLDQIYPLPSHPDILSDKKSLHTVSPEGLPYLREIFEESEKKRHAFRGRAFPYTAIPLWVKDRFVAILVCEQLHAEDMEKFAILSGQVALAIQKVKLYAKLQELAITDGLTHLYSRRYFLERFHEELERSKRHSLSLSFLMADIDHFKQKNDQYGHLVGDVILREVAARLKAHVREIDLVGRYGGEEFSILLPDTGAAEAVQVAERIRSAVANKRFTAYDEVIEVTLSIGVGAYPEDGKRADELIETADTFLYQAKQEGRNRVVGRY